MIWLALDMDAGVVGAFPSKREAIEQMTPGRANATIKVHRYAAGAYDVKWHYKGDPYDGNDFFLERLDDGFFRRDSGSWVWAYQIWVAVGRPMGELGEELRQVRELVDAIESHGFEVKFVEYCENGETPGFLGHIKGVTDWERKLVRIGTKANPGTTYIVATLEHELRHVQDPDWDCGSRDVLGRGGRP